MSTAKTVAKNSSVLIAADVLKGVIYFIFAVYVARMLGSADFGKYSFALNFTILAGIIPDMGLNYFYVREISRNRSHGPSYMGNFMILKTFLSVLTFGLIFVFINLLSYPADTMFAVYGLAVYMIITSYTELFRSSFQAIEKMEYDGIVRFIERVSLVGAGFVLLFAGFALFGVIVASLIGSVFGVFVSFALMTRKAVKPKLYFNLEFSKKVLKTSFPFAIATIFYLLYFSIDAVMLSILKGDSVVGWYSAAYNIVLGLVIIPLSFSTALYPLFSRLIKTDEKRLHDLYGRSLKYMLLLAIPIGIIGFLISGDLIYFLYGPEYSNSVVAFQILIWTGCALFLTHLYGTIMRSSNKEIKLAKISGIAFFVNVFLNALLIPEYSFVGAGVATIITQVIVIILSHIYSFRGVKIGLGMFIKPIICSIPAAIFIILFDINFIAEIIIGFGIYLGFMHIVKGFDNRDIKMLKSLSR